MRLVDSRNTSTTQGLDWDAYVTKHFPGEVYNSARGAAEMVYMAKRPAERTLPDPEKVRAYMQTRGWLREQLEGASCQ